MRLHHERNNIKTIDQTVPTMADMGLFHDPSKLQERIDTAAHEMATRVLAGAIDEREVTGARTANLVADAWRLGGVDVVLDVVKGSGDLGSSAPSGNLNGARPGGRWVTDFRPYGTWNQGPTPHDPYTGKGQI